MITKFCSDYSKIRVWNVFIYDGRHSLPDTDNTDNRDRYESAHDRFYTSAIIIDKTKTAVLEL